MSFTSWANSKIQKLNWLDVVLVELSCIVYGILLAVLIPALIKVNEWWLVAGFIILGLKPGYKLFKRNDKHN